MDKEEKDYTKNKNDMIYNITLEKMLTKDVVSKLRHYYPDTSIEVHFTSFKTGVGVMKRSFHGTKDDNGGVYMKGFPQNGAFKPNGIRLAYDGKGNRGIIEFEVDPSTRKFVPVDKAKLQKFVNMGENVTANEVVRCINNGVKRYLFNAVKEPYGKHTREEKRIEEPGLHFEDYFPY